MPHSDVVIILAGAIGCSIAYHLGKRGMRATVVERESIGMRTSGKAWAVSAYPPTYFAEEEMHQAPRDPAAVDFGAMPEGQSVADWHDLFASSYERMPDVALEIAERGGIDVEYAESPNTLLLTEEDLAGGRTRGTAGPLRSSWRSRDGVVECDAAARALSVALVRMARAAGRDSFHSSISATPRLRLMGGLLSCG
jgi:glycine/D-amino acid oxidase-like deaminating enzyme